MKVGEAVVLNRMSSGGRLMRCSRCCVAFSILGMCLGFMGLAGLLSRGCGRLGLFWGPRGLVVVSAGDVYVVGTAFGGWYVVRKGLTTRLLASLLGVEEGEVLLEC